jgi:uncharacterized ion transporter superfamily protein YfcC
MKKRKENKNDKLILLGVIFLVVAFLSWIIGGYTYQSGKLVEIGMYRAGLYDLLAVIFSGITYKIEDILFILFVGGTYGILTKAESYKKIVNNVVDFIKGKEVIAFAVITLLMGLYTSISNNIMALFFLIPFIMTIFIKSGYDKLTAVGASFGGLFLGYLGQTFSVFTNMNLTSSSSITFLFENLGVKPIDMIVTKFVIFFVAYVLFNVFAILHMKKTKNVDIEENVDMYAVGDVKKITKKSEYIMTWPTVVMGILTIIFAILGYISWNDSFGVELFDKVHSAVMSFTVADIKIMETLIGTNVTAFGTWNNLFPLIFALGLLLLVVVITNRISFSEMVDGFGTGAKSIIKVALVYGLTFAFLYFMSSYPWPTALIDLFLGSKSFNIVLIFIAGLLAVMFCADPAFAGYYFGPTLAVLYSANAASTALVWRIGGAIALLVGPTSFLLLMALTYVDVPYTKWISYIWKFALTFVVAALIIIAVVVYI